MISPGRELAAAFLTELLHQEQGEIVACIKCGSENQNRVRSVVLVIKVERQRELEVTALHCQECGFLEISAPPDAIPIELREPWRDRGRPN